MLATALLLIVTAQSILGAFAFEDERAIGCEINPLQNDNSPLLINKGQATYIYPNYLEETIKFAVGDTIELSCPGSRVLVNGVESKAFVEATCISGVQFTILEERILWTQVRCSNKPLVRGRFTNENCENGGRGAEIGFNVGDGRFLQNMQICFDSTTQSPLYSHFTMTSSIGSSALGTPRPSFVQDSQFYNLPQSVNSLYSRTVQRRTINRLVGLSDTSTKYINNGNLYFLSRGHLTARTDFVYPAQQDSTFRYINAAPQWQSFNGFNWNLVETSTRDYADKNGVELQVWTGVYGVATLPHEKTGNDVELYLYVDDSGNKLPVPEMFWKVVYNPVSGRGIVLVGLNNPFQTDVSRSIICNDVSDSVSWLRWDKKNILAGYSYACTVAAFRRVVSYAPNIQVSGLLV